MPRSTSPGSRPTIKDVAAVAGVSLKTVSRVLNAEAGVAVATATRVRVAAEQLGFRRNEGAAQLRRLDQSSRLIGLVIEDLANPFYSAVARGVEDVVGKAGYLLIVASSDEDAIVQGDIIRALLTRQVDGLVVVPTGHDHDFLLSEIEAGTPVVFVDRPALDGRADVVVAANAEGARHGISHLIAGGHRAIAYLGDDQAISTASERYRGFLEAMDNAGLPVDERLIRLGLHDTAAAAEATEQLLAATPRPTALFTSNNRNTIGAIRALRRRTEQVALVGFDDFELADAIEPPVTVIAQDAAALGRSAAELLMSRLRGDTRPVTKIVLGTTLIVRGSGELSP